MGKERLWTDICVLQYRRVKCLRHILCDASCFVVGTQISEGNLRDRGEV